MEPVFVKNFTLPDLEVWMDRATRDQMEPWTEF